VTQLFSTTLYKHTSRHRANSHWSKPAVNATETAGVTKPGRTLQSCLDCVQWIEHNVDSKASKRTRLQKIQEALLTQMDCATCYVSWNFMHNCRNKLYHKSTTNRSNAVERLVVNSHDSLTVTQVAKTTSTINNNDESHGKISKSGTWGQSSRGKYPNFWRYPNFLISWITESFQYNTGLWQTDRQTVGQRHVRSMYGASTASRSNKLSSCWEMTFSDSIACSTRIGIKITQVSVCLSCWRFFLASPHCLQMLVLHLSK